jgi:hypothetical protein
MKKVLQVDPLTKTADIAQADGEGGLVITTVQDVSDIVESNKSQYAKVDEKAKWSGEVFGNKVASIPLAVFQDLNKMGICRGFAVVDQKKFKAWLNDPANQYFRTRPGRI